MEIICTKKELEMLEHLIFEPDCSGVDSCDDCLIDCRNNKFKDSVKLTIK